MEGGAMTDRELLQEALELMEVAIKAGDWKVDGACDPDMLFNSIRTRLAQTESEAVADKYLMEVECTKCGAKQDGVLTVNAPPQREWQGLTDEEIRNEADRHVFNESFFNGAVWARGKIKEKNNG
jgi:hypothetical protein